MRALGVVEFIVVFAIAWWLVLFMVLPWGVRPQEEPEPGTVESAPARPRLLLKFTVTTGIALVLTFAADWMIASGWFEIRPAG